METRTSVGGSHRGDEDVLDEVYGWFVGVAAGVVFAVPGSRDGVVGHEPSVTPTAALGVRGQPQARRREIIPGSGQLVVLLREWPAG
ncbi:MAG: hypothetical protein ACRDRL_21690 [Sciscionella sp.]